MKEEKYRLLVEQVKALVEGETDETAVMANVTSAMAAMFPEWLWTGFYRVVDGALLLGPFQGPVACYHIAKGRGVCGDAWEQGRAIVVPDVEKYPGHIACSLLSRSEIVVPVYGKDGNVVAVLDIDSPELNTFDAIDQRFMEQIVGIVAREIYT